MNRRGFLTGALGLLAAPAIVRASSIMPVSAQPMAWRWVSAEPIITGWAYRRNPGTFGDLNLLSPGTTFHPLRKTPQGHLMCRRQHLPRRLTGPSENWISHDLQDHRRLAERDREQQHAA